MTLNAFVDSDSYFQVADAVEPGMMRFGSIRGRMTCLGSLIEKLLVLPLALFCKAYKTVFRVAGFAFSAALVLASLGISTSARELFVRRTVSLSKDFTDWLLLPLAMTTCLMRLALAFTVHPALYFKY